MILYFTSNGPGCFTVLSLVFIKQTYLPTLYIHIKKKPFYEAGIKSIPTKFSSDFKTQLSVKP